jgi:hypothetical protein
MQWQREKVPIPAGNPTLVIQLILADFSMMKALNKACQLQFMNVLKIDINTLLFLFQASSCFQCGGNTLLVTDVCL